MEKHRFTCVVIAGLLGVAGSASAGSIKLNNFQAASVVVGQADFSGGSTNQGGSAGANTLAHPYGECVVGPGGVLYLSDEGNNRVLGFKKVPTSNNASADFVLGQPDFTTTTAGDSDDEMGDPETMVIAGAKLIVDDFINHRVLIFNKAPRSTGAAADVVVGQPGFNSNASGCAQGSMAYPESLTVSAGKLIVADSGNHRVLIWKKIPRSNGAPADLVLGQNDFNTCVSNNNGSGVAGSPSASNLAYPSGIWSSGTRLIVNDSDNNRVLIWKKFPKTSFQPADIVLGQPDFTSKVANNDGSGSMGSPSARNLTYPYIGLYFNGSQLFVGDWTNNRVLIWKSLPKTNFQPADMVLGQPDLTSGVANNDGSGASGSPSAQNLDNPVGIYQKGKKLFVTDNHNNRYLIYQGK